jgi:proline iminopeptidase
VVAPMPATPAGAFDRCVVTPVRSDRPPLPALSPGRHVADADGAWPAYTVRGSGPVLLLPSPGWGPSPSHLLPVLARHCTVVHVDSRHRGGSTGPALPGGHGLDHLVAELEALRVHLGSPPVFLAGHGAAAAQALAYAVGHGEHVLGVVAVAALVAADQARFEEMLAAVWRRGEGPVVRGSQADVGAALALVMGLHPPRTARRVLEHTAWLFFADPGPAATAVSRTDVDERLVALSRDAGLGGRDLLPDLHRVQAPVLLVTGEDDVVCGPLSQAGRAHDRLPHSTLAVLSGCGHFPEVEQPDAFAAAVEAWFGGLGS